MVLVLLFKASSLIEANLKVFEARLFLIHDDSKGWQQVSGVQNQTYRDLDVSSD